MAVDELGADRAGAVGGVADDPLRAPLLGLGIDKMLGLRPVPAPRPASTRPPSSSSRQ